MQVKVRESTYNTNLPGSIFVSQLKPRKVAQYKSMLIE